MRARLHALDTLRAFLMLLGVVYHSVQFSLTGHGLSGAAPPYDFFVFFVHTWRMPAFFFLAGFFTELLIDRRGLGEAGRNRLKRVGIPFGLALLFILPLNVFFISAYVDLSQHGTENVWNLDFLREAIWHRWRKPKLHHLWFLYYLLGFLAVYFAARSQMFLRFASRPRGRAWRPLAYTPYAIAGLTLAFMPTPFNVDAPDGIYLRLPEFLFYFSFFALGAGGYGAYRERGKVCLPAPGISLLAALLGFAGLAWGWFTGDRDAALPLGLTLLYSAFKMLSVVGAVYGLIELFQRYAGRESPAIRFLTFASFWTYLVHEPLINFWGTLLRSYTWPVALEILTTSGLTYALSLLSYRYIVRGTWLDGILNGKGKAP